MGRMRDGIGTSKRRGTPVDPPRKTGWQVRASIADAVRQAVEAGAAESQNAFVERALIEHLRELRKARVYESYAAAAADPAFVEASKRVAAAFDPTAGDGLGEGWG